VVRSTEYVSLSNLADESAIRRTVECWWYDLFGPEVPLWFLKYSLVQYDRPPESGRGWGRTESPRWVHCLGHGRFLIPLEKCVHTLRASREFVLYSYLVVRAPVVGVEDS